MRKVSNAFLKFFGLDAAFDLTCLEIAPLAGGLAACSNKAVNDLEKLVSLLFVAANERLDLKCATISKKIEAFGIQALPLLIENLKTNHYMVQEWTLKTCEAISPQESANQMAGLLLSAQGEYQFNLARGLAFLKDMRAFDVLVSVTENGKPFEKFEALKALGNLANERVLPILISAFESTDWNISNQASAALYKCGALAIAPLIKVLENSNTDARINAASHLGQQKDPRAVKPLLDCLNSKEQRLRSYSLLALARIGEPICHQTLIKHISDPSKELRAAVAEGLGICKSGKNLSFLERLIKDPESSVRIKSVISMGQFPDSRNTLVEVLKAEPDIEIKAAAVESLKTIGDSDARAAIIHFRDNLLKKLIRSSSDRKRFFKLCNIQHW